MPADFITIPAAILGALLFYARLTLFRGKNLPKCYKFINWVFFIPISIKVLFPAVLLHSLSLLGNTSAMLELSRRYQEGFNVSFFSSHRMALHYCDEAIAKGSTEAMLRKSYLLKNQLIASWGLGDSFIGDPNSSLYQSRDWIEAFKLARLASDKGIPEGVHAFHSMALLPNPRFYGEGVYLVGKSKQKANRLYVEGSESYFSYLHSSDDWKNGMRILRTDSNDRWVRDLYLIETLDYEATAGCLACKKLRSIIYEYSGVTPLGMNREQRRKMTCHGEWESGLRMLDADARAGDLTAADLLIRLQEFASR